jgi:hypothetical protein
MSIAPLRTLNISIIGFAAVSKPKPAVVVLLRGAFVDNSGSHHVLQSCSCTVKDCDFLLRRASRLPAGHNLSKLTMDDVTVEQASRDCMMQISDLEALI